MAYAPSHRAETNGAQVPPPEAEREGILMKLSHKALIGLAATTGLALAGRALLRARRRIELKGRVVLVTGASTGLGLLVARQAAKAGARLVLAARGEADLRAAEAELKNLGTEVLAVPTDVSDEGQVRNLVARAIERFGKVDILVNNAGIMRVGPIETMTVEDFRELMAVNFWGELLPILAVLPHMKSQGGGRIANVVSVGGKVSVPHMLPYSASKFALTGLTEGLRAELIQDNILVTGIYPGTIRTGGHVNADFKGDRDAEYSWFALSDTIPGISASADHAAQQLWRGVLDGEPEVIVGWNARVASIVHGMFPEWTAEAMALVNRALPRSTQAHGPAVKGQALTGRVADAVNQAIPSGTRPEPA